MISVTLAGAGSVVAEGAMTMIDVVTVVVVTTTAAEVATSGAVTIVTSIVVATAATVAVTMTMIDVAMVAEDEIVNAMTPTAPHALIATKAGAMKAILPATDVAVATVAMSDQTTEGLMPQQQQLNQPVSPTAVVEVTTAETIVMALDDKRALKCRCYPAGQRVSDVLCLDCIVVPEHTHRSPLELLLRFCCELLHSAMAFGFCYTLYLANIAASFEGSLACRRILHRLGFEFARVAKVFYSRGFATSTGKAI